MKLIRDVRRAKKPPIFFLLYCGLFNLNFNSEVNLENELIAEALGEDKWYFPLCSFLAMEVPQGKTDQDREQESSPGLKTRNMNTCIFLQ